MKKLLLSCFALGAIMTQAQAPSWVDQATKFAANFGVDEISIVDANTVWVTAYDGSGAGTYPKVTSRTTNGGTAWTATTVVGPPASALLSDIHAVDANTAFLVTAPFSGSTANGIWKTTNAGAAWTKQTSGFGASSFANQVYFWDANNGWACGDPVGGKFEMYKTSNGGTTWTAVAGAPAPIGGQGGEFSYVAMKHVVGDTVWFGTDLGRIMRSSDRGTTWTGFFSPVLDFGGVTTEGSSGSFTFKDASNGMLVAVDGAQAGGTLTAGLYSTTDGGATWTEVTPTGPWYFGDISYVPGTANTYVSTGINSADDSYMGSSVSNDGGLTWTAIDAGSQRGKLGVLNSTTAWAGQFSDGPAGTKGILKLSGNLNLAVNDAAVKSSLKISPNPASDIVTLTSNKSIERVTIIDMTGKKMNAQKVAADKINVSSLAKGTYVLQVFYVGGAVENTKLIKK